MHFIGMDIHKNYSSVAVTNERGDLVDRCRLNHRHREELIGYFNQFPSRTQVVMEATCGWGWLSELLQDLGLEVKLANPSKVKSIAESQIKTDKVDALALAQLLRTNFFAGGVFSSSGAERGPGRTALSDRFGLFTEWSKE